jgi:S1/P1 Nuclease
VIALIAADRRTPDARAEVADLLGSSALRGMEEASTWADYIRLSRSDTALWHYVNIEISASGYNAATDWAALMYTLIQTAKLNNVDPRAWLADSSDVADALAFALRF